MLGRSGGGDGVLLIRGGCIISDGGRGTNQIAAMASGEVGAGIV